MSILSAQQLVILSAQRVALMERFLRHQGIMTVIQRFMRRIHVSIVDDGSHGRSRGMTLHSIKATVSIERWHDKCLQSQEAKE